MRTLLSYCYSLEWVLTGSATSVTKVTSNTSSHTNHHPNWLECDTVTATSIPTHGSECWRGPQHHLRRAWRGLQCGWSGRCGSCRRSPSVAAATESVCRCPCPWSTRPSRNRHAETQWHITYNNATRGVTVSTSAFLACHQCCCAGLCLAWGLSVQALVCGIFWSWSPGVFSGYSNFLPSFIG